MKTRHCVFCSDGIQLEGLLQLPDSTPLGNHHRRPAIILCSGLQGLQELIPAKLWTPFVDAGYDDSAHRRRFRRYLPVSQTEEHVA